MTGPEHYREAERLIGGIDIDAKTTPNGSANRFRVSLAQVHATLALAAATALGLGRADDHGMVAEDANERIRERDERIRDDPMSPIRVTVADDIALAIATLDSAAATAYNAFRDLGLSIEATKDALTVHLSDTLVACQQQRGDELPADEDDDTGGVRTR